MYFKNRTTSWSEICTISNHYCETLHVLFLKFQTIYMIRIKRINVRKVQINGTSLLYEVQFHKTHKTLFTL